MCKHSVKVGQEINGSAPTDMLRGFMLRHGTSELDLHSILKHGIRPRRTAQTGNYQGPLRSVEGHAYLTRPFALFYASHAAPNVRHFCRATVLPSIIIEVDPGKLDPELLRPDEDALGQYLESVKWKSDDQAFAKALRRLPTDEERTALREIIDTIPGGEHFVTDDTEEMKDYWWASLLLIGSLSYKGVIPPDAFVRYAKIDPIRAPRIAIWGAMSNVNALNYRLIDAMIGEAITNLVLDGTPLPYLDIDASLSSRHVLALRKTIWTDDCERLEAIRERERGVRVQSLDMSRRASRKKGSQAK